jgi:cysteine desulfurase
LYVRRGVKLEPVLRGAGQERGRRPGTENVAQIVGLGVAAELAAGELPAAGPHTAVLRDRLQQALADGVGHRLTVHAAAADRLPNTLSVSFPGISGAELLDKTPQLCASTGAACHSGMTKMSATLAAMGVSPEIARGTIRLSVGRFSTEEDIDTAARLLIDAWRQSS